MTRLTILGAGQMGSAILAGLLDSGWASDEISILEKDAALAAEIAARHRVTATGTIPFGTEVLLVAIKPQDAKAALASQGRHLADTLVLSIMAGITTAQLESWLPEGVRVVRAMPNTPAKVGAGITGIAAGTSATEADLTLAAAILRSIGETVTLPEKYLDALGAVSGSGPAYVFYLAEAMIEAGVERGLTREIATKLVVETLYGSAKLLRESGETPKTLRDQVSSPGGTTIAAIRKLEDGGVRGVVMAAIQAATERSQALSRTAE